jgi:restriction endonuclease Mrr
MTIPDYQSVMLPSLKIKSDKKERFLSDLRNDISQALRLTDEERNELLPSGTQPFPCAEAFRAKGRGPFQGYRSEPGADQDN